MSVVVGIDPGGRYTGIVARYTSTVIEWRSIDLGADWASIPNHHGANQIQAALLDLTHNLTGPILIGIEDVNPPTPHMGIVSLAGLVKTAWYAGALYKLAAALDLDAVMVPPGGNGANPPHTYPAALRKRRPDWTLGNKKAAHLYSAWDVSHTAPTVHRIEQATR